MNALHDVPTSTRPKLVRVRDCEGPAASLATELAAKLAPRTGNMQPDDLWADLAATVPGGFAGMILSSTGKPVVFLTDTSKATEAKRALAGKISYIDVSSAVVRPARWDFAQLVDWYNYFNTTSIFRGSDLVSGDKDEALNRIHYGVLNEEGRTRLVSALDSLGIPCDLVVVSIEPPAIIGTGSTRQVAPRRP